MSIKIFNDEVTENFLNGTVAIKIMASKVKFDNYTIHISKLMKDVHMVIIKEDYEKKLKTHHYTPLLYIAPLPIKLAYLFDCLNRKFGTTRNEYFVFFWRNIGESEWEKWFDVTPYSDTNINYTLGEFY